MKCTNSVKEFGTKWSECACELLANNIENGIPEIPKAQPQAGYWETRRVPNLTTNVIIKLCKKINKNDEDSQNYKVTFKKGLTYATHGELYPRKSNHVPQIHI